MTSSHPTPTPCQWFSSLVSPLDRRSVPRLALLLLGAVLARGRRTVTAWIRAAKLGDQFRSCYTAVAAAGWRADGIAASLPLEILKPMVAGQERLTLALDDTPTKRYGPEVQGAGVHHNPTPGPAGSPFAHARFMSELADLRDQLTVGLSEHPPEGATPVAELAERIGALRKGNTVEAAPERTGRKAARAERPVTARFRERSEQRLEGDASESTIESKTEQAGIAVPAVDEARKLTAPPEPIGREGHRGEVSRRRQGDGRQLSMW